MDTNKAYYFANAPEDYLHQKLSSLSRSSKPQKSHTIHILKFLPLLSIPFIIFILFYILTPSLSSITPPSPQPTNTISSSQSLLELPIINALRTTTSYFQTLYIEPPTPILRSQMRNLSFSLYTFTLNSHTWIEDTVDSLEGLLPVLKILELREWEGGGGKKISSSSSWFRKNGNGNGNKEWDSVKKIIEKFRLVVGLDNPRLVGSLKEIGHGHGVITTQTKTKAHIPTRKTTSK